MAGLTAAQARETFAARELAEAGAALLPARTIADFHVKFALLMGAGEPAPAEVGAFPWSYVRILHAATALQMDVSVQHLVA